MSRVPAPHVPNKIARMNYWLMKSEPETLPGVQGLVLVGLPLHPSGKPSTERAAHLGGVALPMLFLQGTRDGLAELKLITQATAELGKRATLHIVEGADHAFHVLVRSGRDDAQVREELLATIAGWIRKHRV